MSEKFSDRLVHAWNALRGADRNTGSYQNYGMSSGYNPSMPMLGFGVDRTILASILTRIAIDVSSLEFRHVRLGQNERYEETIKSGLNECLTVSANIDQSGRAFIMDVVLSLFDEGCIAIVPVDTDVDPKQSSSYEIRSLRTGRIIEWFPRHVRVEVYDDRDGKKKEVTLPKAMVAIVENPLYQVMNGPNSTLQRLIRKLNLMDVIDNQIGSGKIDIVVQLPYVIKTEARRQEAEKRRKMIEDQLVNSKYGIAYADSAEKITQLNRPAENNMLSQVEYLTSMLYSQLGMTKEVFEGTADETTMLNYENKTVKPVAYAISEALRRTFLTKTARTQGQTVMFFNDPFKLASLQQITEMADTFIRNEIFSSNEVRAILGYKPDPNPESDMPRNPNMPQEESQLEQPIEDEMTEADYRQAFQDLDEIDAELDDLESSLELKHYASPYYDPVKAHEYYMRNRELIGRRSTSGLNEEGKKAARYVKEQLTSERKEKQQDVKDEATADISSVKSQAQRNIESARERKKQQLENHKAAMDAQITALRATIEGLKGDEKKEQSAKVKEDIAGLREENKKQRDQLNAEYAEYTARVRANRSEDISDIRSESSRERASLKTEYDEKYIEELDRIKADPKMQKQKKSSKKSSTKSTKSVLTEAERRRRQNGS